MLDQTAQIAIGGGNDPDIGAAVGLWVQRRFRPINDPQQPCLGIKRHIANLIEEQGAAVGFDELAALALIASEQFGLNPLARRCGQIDHHELAIAATAQIMQGAGDQLLAGARFAKDQGGEVCADQTRDGAIDLLHRGGTTD